MTKLFTNLNTVLMKNVHACTNSQLVLECANSSTESTTLSSTQSSAINKNHTENPKPESLEKFAQLYVA